MNSGPYDTTNCASWAAENEVNAEEESAAIWLNQTMVHINNQQSFQQCESNDGQQRVARSITSRTKKGGKEKQGSWPTCSSCMGGWSSAIEKSEVHDGEKLAKMLTGIAAKQSDENPWQTDEFPRSGF